MPKPPEIRIPQQLLFKLSQFICDKIGLNFAENRWSDLERAIIKSCSEWGYQEPVSFIEWLLSTQLTKSDVERLASYLTVGETYFWREPGGFEALEYHILPEIIERRSGKNPVLRFWSAGCSSGEEPYSIAIALKRLLPDIRNWDITILATDINPKFLEKAQTGIYTSWSFRNIPAGFKGLYFNTLDSKHFEIQKEIREMVAFAHLNLIDDSFPSTLNKTHDMDVIFCRNVMMYFSQTVAKKLCEKFAKTLVEEGFLITSQTELSDIYYPEFERVEFSGNYLYQKSNLQKQAARLRQMERLKNLATYANAPPQGKSQPILKPERKIQKKGELPVAKKEGAVESAAAAKIAQKGGDEGFSSKVLRLVEQGSYKEAREKVIQYLKTSPADANALFTLAKIEANLGRLDVALVSCEKAIILDVLNARAHYLLATILQEKGQVPEAKSALKRAIYMEPDFLIPNFSLGNIALAEGKTAEAHKYFSNTLKQLDRYKPEDLIPESEGLTAQGLRDIIIRLLR